MEKLTIVKIGTILLLLYLVRILYKNSKVAKKDYMEDLLKQTQEVKGQWDR